MADLVITQTPDIAVTVLSENSIELTLGAIPSVTVDFEVSQGPAGPQGIQGPIGPQGIQGPVGEGVKINGVLTNTSELPSGASIGDAYVIGSDLWVWDGDSWDNAGPITGPQGEPGVGVPVGGTAGQVLTKVNSTDYNTTWSDVVTPTGTQTLSNKTVTNLVFDGDYTEEVFTITDSSSVDLDPSNGTIQLWTLGANRSPTASSFASGQSLTLMIDDGSAFQITWPSVTWKTDSGLAPTLNTSGFTAVTLWKVGSVLYGARVGDA